MKFSTKEEKKYQKTFLKNGYLIFDIKNKKILDQIKNLTIKLCIKWLKKKKNFFVMKNKKEILDKIHNFIEPKELNEFRLYIYGSINGSKNFQKLYYNLGKEYIDILCGNELVMQKKCNLSIQLPKDDSSLLPLHADVWVGDSEYELVFWLPLVNVYKTKAMYILPPKDNDKYSKNFKKYRSVNDIFNKVKKNIKWLKVDYGQGLLFTQNLMHGNVVNVEKGTRWSFNCRFKSIFSPYRDKELGAFFTPITVRPLTILGINYKFPNV